MSPTVVCPNCGHDMGADLSDFDYATRFSPECPKCEVEFSVEVEFVPWFYCTQKSQRGFSPKEGEA